jgi:hypothetical protein
MQKVILKRTFSDKKQTLGVLSFMVPGKELFVCKTLELPWAGNKKNISCIPAGTYTCRWTSSPKMSNEHGHLYYTYEVLNVPGRTGIRIHSANYFFQLLGCIALGDAHKDINSDGELDTIRSGYTVEFFNNLMDKKDFLLVIE